MTKTQTKPQKQTQQHQLWAPSVLIPTVSIRSDPLTSDLFDELNKTFSQTELFGDLAKAASPTKKLSSRGISIQQISLVISLSLCNKKVDAEALLDKVLSTDIIKKFKGAEGFLVPLN
jgi:hypothetical protein